MSILSGKGHSSNDYTYQEKRTILINLKKFENYMDSISFNSPSNSLNELSQKDNDRISPMAIDPGEGGSVGSTTSGLIQIDLKVGVSWLRDLNKSTLTTGELLAGTYVLEVGISH